MVDEWTHPEEGNLRILADQAVEPLGAAGPADRPLPSLPAPILDRCPRGRPPAGGPTVRGGFVGTRCAFHPRRLPARRIDRGSVPRKGHVAKATSPNFL